MKLFELIKKNLIYSYAIFGFFLFLILSSINFLYDKYVLDLTIGYKYNVSAIQYNDFKKQTYDELLNQIMKEDLKTLHRVKNIQVDSPGLTLKKVKNTPKFQLILNDYVDEKKLEDLINKKYINSINKVVYLLEENLPNYDYETIKSSYLKFREKEIIRVHDRLVSSEFFKKYPPVRCTADNVEFCLNNYIKFYLFVLNNLTIVDETKIRKFLNIKEDQIITISQIFEDFTNNKNLYSNHNFLNMMSENELNQSSYKNKFYSKKFKILKNSEFFSEYNVNNYCRTYEAGCLKSISEDFNKILYQHKLETKHFYKVKYTVPKHKEKFHILPETLKILGFTILITYILFILTNRFFNRKSK